MIMKYLHTRITPAYAGKSCIPSIIAAPVWDHPCVCGEKCFGTLRRIGGQGSPLRMRGKVYDTLVAVETLGITPAYAGKSISEMDLLNRLEDHPCVCGEKAFVKVMETMLLGSPLRMRGKDICFPCVVLL